MTTAAAGRPETPVGGGISTYLGWFSDLLADDLPFVRLILFDCILKCLRLLKVSLFLFGIDSKHHTSSSANSA